MEWAVPVGAKIGGDIVESFVTEFFEGSTGLGISIGLGFLFCIFGGERLEAYRFIEGRCQVSNLWKAESLILSPSNTHSLNFD